MTTATQPTEQHETIDHHAPSAQRRTPRTTKKVIAFLAGLGVAGAALAAVGIAPRTGREAELATTTQAVADARRTVSIVTPSRDGASYDLRLPGSTAPVQTTILYARTNGYLKAFHVDIGDHVKAGQVLAEIESPEVDDQLREARANLEQNRANQALVGQRLDRTRPLLARQSASRAEVDDLIAQNNSALAAVRVSEAVVSRLEKDQSYQKVIAPFDGVVTQRNVELGSLVTAGSSAGVTPLFRIEQNDLLKVYIDAPQSAAPSIAIGQAVQVEVRELPGKTFAAKVVRTAGTVDPATRTLRTEIHVPNPTGELLAGAYAQVHLSVQDPRKPLRIPAAALVIDASGPQVVTVDAQNHAHRKPVQLGRDFGREIEVTQGLNGEEGLVVSPRDDLREGDEVTVR